MIKCPECNHQLVEQTTTCPECGVPLPKKPRQDASQFQSKPSEIPYSVHVLSEKIDTIEKILRLYVLLGILAFVCLLYFAERRLSSFQDSVISGLSSLTNAVIASNTHTPNTSVPNNNMNTANTTNSVNTTSFEAKPTNLISLVKQNMHTIQTTAETYAVDHGGVYPINVQVLYDEANQRRYWREIVNPISGNKGVGNYAAVFTPQFKSGYSPGMVMYIPIGNGDIITSYRILGTDETGNIIKEQGQDFFLTNR